MGRTILLTFLTVRLRLATAAGYFNTKYLKEHKKEPCEP
jgi:hypothetical protein